MKTAAVLPQERRFWNLGLPGMCLVMIVICLWLFFETFRDGAEAASSVRIGTVGLVRKTAQRRAARRVMFEAVQSPAALAQGDTIRTGVESEALLRLSGGTEVKLDELSMVVLHIRRGVNEIDVKRGQARVVARGRRTILRIGGRLVEIENSTVVVKEDPESGRIVMVEVGAATVREGKTLMQIKPGSLAVLGDQGLTEQELPVYATGPGDGATLPTETEDRAVELTWQAASRGEVLLEWGSTRAMGNQRRLTMSAAGSSWIRFRPGQHYWRVGSVGSRPGPIRSLRVVKLRPPALLLPTHRSILRTSAREALVSFAFLGSELLDKYMLIVASDPALRNRLHGVPVQVHSVALALPQGSYFWTIAAEGPGRRYLQAQPGFFRIVPEEVRAPSPLWPASGAVVSLRVLSGPGVVFRWEGGSSFSGYRFELASDRAFGKPIFSTTTARPFVAFRHKASLGTCFWRVVGLNLGKEFPSRTSALVVQPEDQLELKSPAPDAQFEEGQNVRFHWAASGGPASFRLLVDGEGGSFEQPVLQEVLRGYGAVRALAAPGRYHWKVQILQASRVVAESNSRSFRIIDSVAPPLLRFPGPGAVVDMSARTELSFDWRGNAASYTLTLDRVPPGIGRRVLNLRVRGSGYSHENLTDLDEGSYEWSVRAHASDGRLGPPATAPFSIRLVRQPSHPRVLLPRGSAAE